MHRKQIIKIITKYRNLSTSCYDDEDFFGRFADYIEDNMELFDENEFYETEEDLLESFKQAGSEDDAQWDSMFPEGDDDDSITDYLTS